VTDGAPDTAGAFARALARRHGDRPLVVLGDERLSYAEADERSAALARSLLACGVGKGTRVGLLMPNGPDWVVAWLAAARVGALVVPLNTFLKARELGWVLGHADVDTLLCVDRFLGNDYPERLERFAPELSGQTTPLRCRALPYLRRVFVWGDGPAWTRSRAQLAALNRGHPALDDAFLRAVEARVDPADPMVVIYSSGSTADPKGAVHAHGAVLRHARRLNAYRGLGPDDRIYSPMPFFWVGGFVFSLLSAMHAGACLVTEEVFEPGATLALLERERVTVVAGWPHYGKALVEHPDFPRRDLSSLRAGNLWEILPGGPVDPALRPNSLGMTETCGPHTMDRMDRVLPEALRGSFGRAVPGVEHRVVDPATGEALPPGATGEICVRGESLMLGLYKVERAATFDADGFYHTGDAGHFDADGVLFFEGRLGELIKTAGANVTPREVEAVLAALSDVAEAHVVGVPHPDRGENVAAAVVLREGCGAERETLRAAARRELSAYKVPRHLFFVRREELPSTDTGKVDKRRLRAWLAERIAGGDAG
jgi:acyl-CoA synthetase (AMP-forming)/AMP-acid ligase II